MTATGPAAEAFAAAFEARADARAAEPPFLREARRAAFARFAAAGFPGPREEDWRFTSLAAVAKTPFSPATRLETPGSYGVFVLGDAPGPMPVFENGAFIAENSAPVPPDLAAAGLRVEPIGRTLRDDPAAVEAFVARAAEGADPFAALNLALFEGGAYVRVPAGLRVVDPIYLVFVSYAGDRPGAAHPRNLVVLETGAAATIVEVYVGLGGRDADPCLTNAVTEIVAGDGSAVEHVRVQREGAAAVHLGALSIRAGRGARVAARAFHLGAALSRLDLRVLLDGEGSEATVDGLCLLDGRRHHDTRLLVDHARPGCTSREAWRSILSGESTGVFRGRIHVRPGADRTDAKETCRNLLLSEKAVAHAMPQLEIYADDVRCTHGATTGALDEDSLFYLRSRGLDRGAAERLLARAFAEEIVGAVRVDPVRRALEAALAEGIDAAIGRAA